MTRAAFYTVSDERYFLGAVGLVNSLRLVGHTEPIHVLDLGLTDAQRGLLAPEATIVEGDPATPPWLSKTIAPLRHPADVMVLIDADMIVTRSLDEPIGRARAGAVVAVEHGSDRFFPEWGELLDLGPLERGTYVCSGLLIAPRDSGGRILRLLDDRQGRVDIERTWFRNRDRGYPFLFPEQDILNAILASRETERVDVIERRLEPIPPFAGVEVVDEATLECAYDDGVRPYLLHHYAAKPWLEESPEGPYALLLRRLLLGDDVAVRVSEGSLPRHLRSGYLAAAIRSRASGGSLLGSYVREPIARALRGGGRR